jgi:heptosyltransferase-3
VVLSLPMVVALKARHPGALVSFLARTYTRDLIKNDPGVHSVLTSDVDGVPKPFWSLVRELRRSGIDAAVVASPTLRMALLIRCAGIPVRVGTGYRWYSLLFNRRVFEHRKTAEKHESEYNVSLLGGLGLQIQSTPLARLTIPDGARREAVRIRTSKGFAEGDQIAVLHPGSGGSARDWSPENFGQLAARLADMGVRVLVTGGWNEKELVTRVCRSSGLPLATSVAEMDLLTLAALLSTVSLFVSNSTGPLHIAAAVGVPVIAFYPPIIQCSPRRWGPLAERKVIFEADAAKCPRCHGGPCQGNDCMDLITVEEVAEAARGLLRSDHHSRTGALTQ